jgi:membrane protease YdiL (CAAX protease family)
VGGAVLVVGTRIGLWLGVQLLVAGLLVLVGASAAGQALDEAAGWWMVYGGLVDLGTLGVIFWLLRRDGGSYRRLLGPPTSAWQLTLGAAGVLAASVPAVVFSGQLTSALYGQDATAPMFALVELPGWASVVSVLVVPLLAELAEPVAFLGVVLPRLERRLGRSWLAAAIVVALWAAEHALYPLLVSGGGLDWEFAAYRWGRCCRSWSPGPPPTTPWDDGCCRSWRPGGSSTPAPPSPWPWASSHELASASRALPAAGDGPYLRPGQGRPRGGW